MVGETKIRAERKARDNWKGWKGFDSSTDYRDRDYKNTKIINENIGRR